jgi:Asp-tRNA(Asn)/Glu-tRNA(Gln) amidotransferase B subunit
MIITFNEEQFIEILTMYKENKITVGQAVQLLEIIGTEGGSPADIAEKRKINSSDP